jgi:hypothetical protein
VRRLGLEPGRHRLTELWSGVESTASGNRLVVRVPSEDVRLYGIYEPARE